MKTEIQINLKKIRDKQELSLRDLEELSGVSRSQIGKIENKQSIRQIETICRIAAALNVSLSDLINFK